MKKIKRHILQAVITCTVILLANPSPAEDIGLSGINLNTFSPSMDGKGIFTLNAPQGLGEGEISFSLTQMAAFQNLFEINVDGVETRLLSHIIGNHASMAIGINEYVSIGFDLPYYYSVSGTNFDSLQTFTTMSLGDTRLNFKFEFLKEKEFWPGMSLQITTDFPTGNDALFVSNSHIVPGFDFIFGKDLKYLSVIANAGMRFPWKTNILGLSDDDRVTFGAGVKVPINFIDRRLSFLGEVRGNIQYKGNISTFTSPVEFTAGLKKEFKNGLAITAGGGGAWNNAMGNPRIRGILGLNYQFNPFRKNVAVDTQPVINTQQDMAPLSNPSPNENAATTNLSPESPQTVAAPVATAIAPQIPVVVPKPVPLPETTQPQTIVQPALAAAAIETPSPDVPTAITEEPPKSRYQIIETYTLSSENELSRVLNDAIRRINGCGTPLVALIEVSSPQNDTSSAITGIRLTEKIRSFLLKDTSLTPAQISFSSDSWNQNAMHLEIKIKLLQETIR